jgi:Na+-driven multidrug efflux pump
VSKKKKKGKPAAKTRPVRVEKPLQEEERSAELVTVAWMLCTLLTCVTVTLHLASQIYLGWNRGELAERHPLTSLLIVLNFIALFAGLLTLVLIPAVHKLRKTKPPVEITFFALLVGALPWALLLLRVGQYAISTIKIGVE